MHCCHKLPVRCHASALPLCLGTATPGQASTRCHMLACDGTDWLLLMPGPATGRHGLLSRPGLPCMYPGERMQLRCLVAIRSCCMSVQAVL
uniref:Uncharacterized protein n=1 Tax=Chlamydomonas euryale TaxID=1486919 RepID=A0A7R9V540_9CHLO